MDTTSQFHAFPMTVTQVDELLRRVGRGTESVHDSKRRVERSPMRDRGVIIVYEDSDEPELFDAPICNISPTGICFLHTNMLNPGQRLSIRLPHYVTSGAVERDIIIMRSREIDPSIFEIGAEFWPEFFD